MLLFYIQIIDYKFDGEIGETVYDIASALFIAVFVEIFNYVVCHGLHDWYAY